MTDHTTKLMQEKEMQNNVKSIVNKLVFGESLFIEENSKYIIIHPVNIEQNKINTCIFMPIKQIKIGNYGIKQVF